MQYEYVGEVPAWPGSEASRIAQPSLGRLALTSYPSYPRFNMTFKIPLTGISGAQGELPRIG